MCAISIIMYKFKVYSTALTGWHTKYKQNREILTGRRTGGQDSRQVDKMQKQGRSVEETVDRLYQCSEEVGRDIISHDSHMSTAPRNADSATYSP